MGRNTWCLINQKTPWIDQSRVSIGWFTCDHLFCQIWFWSLWVLCTLPQFHRINVCLLCFAIISTTSGAIIEAEKVQVTSWRSPTANKNYLSSFLHLWSVVKKQTNKKQPDICCQTFSIVRKSSNRKYLWWLPQSQQKSPYSVDWIVMVTDILRNIYVSANIGVWTSE